MKKFHCDDCGEIDCALLDGYQVGDRLLEGVMFEIVPNKESFDVRVKKEAAHYFKSLNQKKWLKAAREFLPEEDILSCPECGADVENLFYNDDL